MNNAPKPGLELPPDVQKIALKSLLAEAKAQAEGRILQQTEADRILATMYVRLLETLLYGAPRTELPSRHHA